MSTSPRTFRQIAPTLDVPDAALDALNDRMGVPTMVKPSATPAPKIDAMPENPGLGEVSRVELGNPSQKSRGFSTARKTALVAKSVKAPQMRLSLDLPLYLADALKREALERRSSVRYLVLKSLQEFGFAVEPQDLFEDGRRHPNGGK